MDSSCEYVDSWRGVHVHLGEGFHQPSLYHYGGMTFLVRPRVNIRDLKHRRRNGTTPPTGSEIFPLEPSGHALGCQNVVQPSSTTESEQVFALVKT